MSIKSQSVDSDVAKSLSDKSEQELISILENSADWRPEVVDFVRSELEKRSISTAQVDQLLLERARQKDEELQRKSRVKMTFWESVFTALYGACLGLLGLLFVWHQVSVFKSEGFALKVKRSWRLYWYAFGVRMAVLAVLIAIMVLRSH